MLLRKPANNTLREGYNRELRRFADILYYTSKFLALHSALPEKLIAIL